MHHFSTLIPAFVPECSFKNTKQESIWRIGDFTLSMTVMCVVACCNVIAPMSTSHLAGCRQSCSTVCLKELVSRHEKGLSLTVVVGLRTRRKMSNSPNSSVLGWRKCLTNALRCGEVRRLTVPMCRPGLSLRLRLRVCLCVVNCRPSKNHSLRFSVARYGRSAMVRWSTMWRVSSKTRSSNLGQAMWLCSSNTHKSLTHLPVVRQISFYSVPLGGRSPANPPHLQTKVITVTFTHTTAHRVTELMYSCDGATMTATTSPNTHEPSFTSTLPPRCTASLLELSLRLIWPITAIARLGIEFHKWNPLCALLCQLSWRTTLR